MVKDLESVKKAMKRRRNCANKVRVYLKEAMVMLKDMRADESCGHYQSGDGKNWGRKDFSSETKEYKVTLEHEEDTEELDSMDGLTIKGINC